MDEHRANTPTNSGIRNMNLVFDAPSFSLGLTQEDLVKVVSNPLQLKKSERSKEIRLKFRNDEVKMTEILKKKGGENNDEDAEKFVILYFLHLFVLSNVEIVVIPRLHFDLVDSERYKDFPWGSLSFVDLARSLNNRLKTGGKFYLIQGMPLAIQVWLYECYSNPPKIVSKADIEISRTPAPCAAKAVGIKTLVFKPIPTRQVASSKTKKGKQTARVIFSQVQSKVDSYVEEVAVSKPESHVEKKAFISKKVFDAFCDEVHKEFKEIRHLVKKRFKRMLKAIEQSKQQYEGTDLEAQQMDYGGVETSPQQFNPTIDQNLGENQDATKITDEKMDQTNLSDS
ncbi:hypothetical protein FXO38_35664 [Capsicum annuum]|nr:hypothetical protein FXO38_35664 [Capsicum annuum]KAF3614699.1 hypothetical protein FXO37_35854 [Capsicum annuum]